MSITQHFVSNTNIPDFIKTDFELFDAFVKAYYEWLELSNDSDNTTNLDIYKSVGNPGYIINNQDIVVDLDETIDAFIDFFAAEIVPISLEGMQTNPRFFLKKVRDIYLAKGTIKSFKLFFKLYYNDNIEVFETRDTVLRASDGKYFAFPTAFFYISDYKENLDKIDFTLAQILDSDDNVLGTILEGGAISKTRDNEVIVKTQFSDEIELKQSTNYYIRNADDGYTIQVRALVSLSEFTMKDGGSLYDVKDPVYVESAAFGAKFTGSVKSTTKGLVEGLKVRNRGIYYTAGDYLRFEIGDEQGAAVYITETGNIGDIISINKYPLRTGTYNSGYLAGTLEDVYVPIPGMNRWSELPDVKYTSTKNYTNNTGNPYEKVTDTGLGLQSIPVSRSIGKANFVSLDQETFFKDSDDVILNAPMTVVVENNTLKKGDKVAFQYFGDEANYHPFRDDSEKLLLRWNFYRIYESTDPTYKYLDSEIQRSMNITIPYGFDSETFTWKFKNANINTRNQSLNFWKDVTDLIDSEGNLNYKINTFSYINQRIDGGFYEPIYYVTVYHPYTTGNVPQRNIVSKVIPHSPDGTIDNAVEQLRSFDSLDDSEVFDNFIDFMNISHGGPVDIQKAVMFDIEDIDGGTPFSFTIDSELDGGLLGEFYDEIKEGWDDFDLVNGKISVMRVAFPDWVPDSDIEGYQSFTEDSDDIVEVRDGGDFFGFAGAKTEVLEIEYEGHYMQTLEDLHLNSIDSEGVGLDSDIAYLDYIVIPEEPRILDNNEDSDVGIWVDTGHYGEVVSIGSNNKVVKIVSYDNSILPTQAELDDKSEDKYKIIKLSPLKDGVSIKDHSLPLNNVVHQVDRIELEYKTSVVSSLFQKFYNQDGFISSDYGGTIQDNYYYSDWSYRIKTQLPMQTWKEKFKTLLHPAGMVLTSDYSVNIESKANVDKVDTYNSDNFRTNLTFDMQQEFLDLGIIDKGITTDGIYYKANAFEAVSIIDDKATALNAASQTSVSNLAYKQQSGNAWWDYEPIGYTRKLIDSEIELLFKNVGDNYLNWDSDTLLNKITTQDSDGNGFVKNDYYYFQYFDGSKQDFYKNQSRVANKLDKDIMISKVQFEDAGLNAYVVYDSELPDDLFANFNDSDDNFRSIDYQRLKSDSDNRYFQLFKIPRTWDIVLFKERDLALAMREDGSLVFDDSDKIYYDYEAYERKWNTVNNKRTRNNEGYTVKGYNQYKEFVSHEQRSKRRSKEFITTDNRIYSQKNAPYHTDPLERDTLVWNKTYYDQINNKIIIKDYEKETFKDPKVSMRGRRGR